MEQFKINKELLEAVLQYLASKPYTEVAQVIKMLSQLEKVKLVE